MKLRKIAVVGMMSALLVGGTAACSTIEPPTVETVGTSVTTLQNDSTTINYSVIFDAGSPDQANRRAQEVLSRINEGLKQQIGVQNDQFKTVSANTSDVEDTNERRATITTDVSGISTAQTLPAIDTILTRGGMNVRLESVTASPSKNAQEASVESAFENAKQKAEAIASASGDKLGAVRQVVSQESSVSPRKMEAASAQSFDPGTQDVSTTITVRWVLK